MMAGGGGLPDKTRYKQGRIKPEFAAIVASVRPSSELQLSH